MLMKTNDEEQALRYALARHIVDVARDMQKKDLPKDFNPSMLFAFIDSAARVSSK